MTDAPLGTCARCGGVRLESAMVASPLAQRRVCRGCLPTEERAAKAARSRTATRGAVMFRIEGEVVTLAEIQQRVGGVIDSNRLRMWAIKGPLTWDRIRRNVERRRCSG